MAEEQKKDIIKFLQSMAVQAFWHLVNRWYLLLFAVLLGAGYGYYKIRNVKPMYTASYTFVLSTDQAGRGNALAGLASQLGFDGLTSSPDNIFSGDNIIELFKSRKLIGSALLSEVDTATHETLLNYILRKQFANMYKKLGPLNNKPATYDKMRTSLYRMAISRVGSSFVVFKKDKKLIFYVISATNTDPDVAYYVAKNVLNETSRYFIDTRTKVSASGVQLLQHEADSLGDVLNRTFSSTAVMNDHTYNLNPSLTVQRSGSIFNQAKANAFAGAYTEVMRNLEVAKITLQKETPLYRIIDEPELPLSPTATNKRKYIIYASAIVAVLMGIILISIRFYKDIVLYFK
ncbi:hypothetical protein ACFGVR_13435 [Mucilaginibacter sp. AW1-3]